MKENSLLGECIVYVENVGNINLFLLNGMLEEIRMKETIKRLHRLTKENTQRIRHIEQLYIRLIETYKVRR